jgi:hypothetical protein
MEALAVYFMVQSLNFYGRNEEKHEKHHLKYLASGLRMILKHREYDARVLTTGLHSFSRGVPQRFRTFFCINL